MEKEQNLFSRINNTIAVFITNIVGTMWCAYAFAILVIIPLFYPQTNTFIQYISSAFLQLVLLPLIMVGQNVLNSVTENRAKRDHKMIKEELSKIREMSAENDKIIEMLTSIQEQLKK